MAERNRKPNCKCSVCGLAVYRRPFQIERGPVFCGVRCSSNRHKPDPNCVVCGTVIIGRKEAKTCGRTCANKSRTGSVYKIGRPDDKAAKFNFLKVKLLEIRPNKCNRCPYSKIEILQVHHVIERCNGGSDELDNLELLCPTCHVEHHYYAKTKE